MADTELIPRINEDGVVKANAELENLKLELAPLKQRIREATVDNPATFELVALDLKKVRDNKKKGAWILAPFKSIAKTITDTFRTMELQHQNACTEIEGMAEGKLNTYKARERELAAAEERRINEARRQEAERQAAEQRKRDEEAAAAERKRRDKEIAEQSKTGEVKKREAEKLRKQAEEEERKAKEQAAQDAETLKNSVQDVAVRPNTPKIAGLRQHVNWKFTIVDIEKIPRAFLYPTVGPDGKYKPSDFPQIGKFVRGAKDKALIERCIPGIVVEPEDAI